MTPPFPLAPPAAEPLAASPEHGRAMGLWREAGVLLLFVAEAAVVAGGIVLAAFHLT